MLDNCVTVAPWERLNTRGRLEILVYHNPSALIDIFHHHLTTYGP